MEISFHFNLPFLVTTTSIIAEAISSDESATKVHEEQQIDGKDIVLVLLDYSILQYYSMCA